MTMADTDNKIMDPIEAAYKRFGILMVEMRSAVANKDKARLVHLGESFMEHGDDVLSYMFDEAGVTDGDITQFGSGSITDNLMVKLASKTDDEVYLKKTAEADSRRD
jgi:hypothetical protein